MRPTSGLGRQRQRHARSPSTPTPLFTDNPRIPRSCTNFYGVRINPSNTGNVRMQSLWHLGDNLRLTFDPSCQYTLANGGGTRRSPRSFGNTADMRPVGNTNVPAST